MKQKLKMYLHHSHYEPVTYNKRTGVFSLIAHFVTSISYWVGLAVLQTLLLPYTLITLMITNQGSTRNPSRIHFAKKFQSTSFRKAILAFTLVAFIAGAGVQGLGLVAAGQNMKGRVLGTSDIGLSYLQDAKVSLDAQNTAAAQVHLGKALEQFKHSKEQLRASNIALRGLLAVVPQKHDADSILSAAEFITQAGIKGTELISETESLKLSAVGLTTEGSNEVFLRKIEQLLTESVHLAEQAALEINRVRLSSIPEQHQQAFLAAKDVAALFQANASSLKEVSSLLFDIMLGQKNILIVFQNDTELRPSGGFLGTVGNARLQDGALTSLDIRSVYDWDGQLQEKILPPQPVHAVNDRWYLRDSNWFAHFPTSAARISSFFEKEGGETPDLVVAMTPAVILDMLDHTGPITLPQHGVTLTKENFIEQTQIQTSVEYDKTLNQPKQFLADFFPILMEEFGKTKGMMDFLEVFQRNLYKKNVLLFSRDSEIQHKISQFNWGGELRATDRDYLHIVNTNLGGTKTDRDMRRNINLETSINDEGLITNTLKYSVKNENRDSRLSNKSFIRVYVPRGSKLEISEGFSNTITLPRIDEPSYTVDGIVQEWQKNVTQDTSSGTYQGVEDGKTWFGNWLEVRAGETKIITLQYTLPFKIQNIDRHSILVQKQAGSTIEPLKYTLTFSGRSSLWNSNNATVEEGTLTYNQDLMTDVFVGLAMEQL